MRTFKQAAAASIAMAALSAHASVITFDSVPAKDNNETTFGSIYRPLPVGDYVFTTLGLEHHGHIITNPGFCGDGGCADNGSHYLGGDMANLYVTGKGGAAFNALGFDAAQAVAGAFRPQRILVEGARAGGGMVSAWFDLSEARFNTFALSGFSNITSLTFHATDANGTRSELWFGMDNLNVTAVPEPASYAMLIAGLGMLAVAARRRQQTGLPVWNRQRAR